ncbi:unnamed protein product [Coregonus sp. 'balchen']|nr:unnamed protein product [Coregonus sp. 'balchen']
MLLDYFLPNTNRVLHYFPECRGEDSVIQSAGDVIPTAGEQVTLDCQFDAFHPKNLYLFWYKHEVNGFPKFMLGRFSFGSTNATKFKDRFDADLDADSKSVPLTIQRVKLSDSAVLEKQHTRLTVNVDKVAKCVDLKISSAEVTDSALYYCALRPTVTEIPETLQKPYCNKVLLFIMKADPLNSRISAKLNEEKKLLDLEISSAEVTTLLCVVRPTVTGNLHTLGEEAVDQQSGHVTALEGGLVTLSCNYTTSSTSPDLFWYIQLTRDSPQYVLRRDRYSEGSNSDEFKKRFDSRLNFTSSSVPLMIQRLQLSDSAVYYCALRPTVNNT